MSEGARPIRAAAIVPAALAGALAAAFFAGPFPIEALLPAVLGVGGGAAAVLFPALAIGRRGGPLATLAAAAFSGIAAVLPAAGAAYAVGAADAAGAARGLGVLALTAALALAALRARRLPARGILLGAMLISALPPVARFIGIALAGEDRSSLAALSPLTAPAAALGSPTPVERRRPEGGRVVAPEVKSATQGIHRVGIPTAVDLTADAAAPLPLVLVGEEPPFAAAPARGGRVTLFPVFHGARPALGPALADPAPAIDWRPVPPGEEAHLLVDPRLPRVPRRPATAVVAEVPGSLGVLRAFDRFSVAAGARLDERATRRLEAARIIAAEAALALRPDNPALDPGRYDIEMPPRLPAARRRILLAIALLGSVLVTGAACLPGRAGTLAPLVAGVLAGGAAFFAAPSARVLVSERAILYLSPGVATAAERRAIEVSAPSAPARADVSFPPDVESLEAVLFRRPEPIPYAIVHDAAGGPRSVGLTFAAGERRIFEAWRPLALPGAIETSRGADGALRVLNRTGRDYLEAILVGPHGAALSGPLPDGGALALPLEPPTGFQAARGALEARGPEWAEAARALAHLLAGTRAPEGGRLVLIGPPAAPATHGAPVEARLSIALLPLGPR